MSLSCDFMVAQLGNTTHTLRVCEVIYRFGMRVHVCLYIVCLCMYQSISDTFRSSDDEVSFCFGCCLQERIADVEKGGVYIPVNYQKPRWRTELRTKFVAGLQ